MPIHSRLVNAWRNVRDAEKYIWCNRSNCFRYVSRSVQCGVSNMWHCNAILTNLDPFHTIEQKRHSTLMAIDLFKKNLYDTSFIISPNGTFLQLLPIEKFHKAKWFEIWFWLPVYTTACICTQYDWFLIFYIVFLIVTFFYKIWNSIWT